MFGKTKTGRKKKHKKHIQGKHTHICTKGSSSRLVWNVFAPPAMEYGIGLSSLKKKEEELLRCFHFYGNVLLGGIFLNALMCASIQWMEKRAPLLGRASRTTRRNAAILSEASFRLALPSHHSQSVVFCDGECELVLSSETLQQLRFMVNKNVILLMTSSFVLTEFHSASDLHTQNTHTHTPTDVNQWSQHGQRERRSASMLREREQVQANPVEEIWEREVK